MSRIVAREPLPSLGSNSYDLRMYTLTGSWSARKLEVEQQFSSVQFSYSVMSNSLRSHGLQHTRPPCPSPTTRVYSNSSPLSQWCQPTISSSVVPFSHLQSFPASGSFQMCQFFASGGQSIRNFSFSISPSSEYSGLIFRKDWLDLLVVQGLSRVFSSTIVQKHQFFGTQLSL